jgi:hypothetical protein
MKTENRHIEELLNDLIRRPSYEFPKDGPMKDVGVSAKQGVYIIYSPKDSPKDSIVHVGRTQRGRGGLQQRLDNHLYGQSSFADEYLKGQGKKLRRGYKFRYLVVKNARRRALLEALAIGKLCPKHFGLGEKAKLKGAGKK